MITLEYRYGPWEGPLVLPLHALIILIAACAGISGMLEKDASLLFRFGGLVVLGVSVWLGACFVHWLPYRHAFRTKYVLNEIGVTIESPDGDIRILAWNQFERASYQRTLRITRLFSPLLSKPVVLIFGTGGEPEVTPDEKQAMARQLLSTKLADRFKTSWW